jgi:hypothetical protein
MSDAATKPHLERLARIIDPPAWLEHDDLIARAEGWERAHRDRPDEVLAEMAKGRRRDAAKVVEMSISKAAAVLAAVKEMFVDVFTRGGGHE